MRVKGYVGSVLTYDATCTLSTTVSTLVTFDYSGVTKVEFSTSDNSQFVLDNVAISVGPFAAPPVIVMQPVNRTVSSGGTVTFSVTAGGTPPLSYQWSCNGTNLMGATNTTLTLTNVQFFQAGNYALLVTNAFGSVLSSNASLTVLAVPPTIDSQPTNQTVFVGGTVILCVTAAGSLPLSYQWSFNGTNLNRATNSSLTLNNVQFSQTGNYAVLVTNAYGSVTSSNATLTVVYPSTPDSFNPNANDAVYCTAVQADGKIMVGGDFTTLGGQIRNYLGRLNADGTLDASFNPGANGWVRSLAVQPDGKILVGGDFTLLGGQSRNYLGRVNADGTVDTGFNAGANDIVLCMAVQADGKILVGGLFTALGGQSCSYLGRLNADGTLDTSFDPGARYSVSSLAVQADGKIVVGGDINTLGGQSRNYLGRVNADGTLDTSFNPGANGEVNSLVVQADGKIVVGGYFTMLAGQNRSYLGRLNADGTVDTGFNPGANNYVNSLAIQVDGKIVVGGTFNTLGGQSCNQLGRVNSDGTVDTGFNPGANSTVNSLAVQADGEILVGGYFTILGGQSRNYIGRLTPTVPATQSLAFDGSTIIWLRGGSSPEVWRTSFEGSTNGSSWIPLGAGTRVAGGWQLSGLAWPTNAPLRARGFVAGGYLNGSGWFVETVAGPPVFVTQPTNQTVMVGETATFNVSATGTPPLSYQWNFNGTNISGATNTTLTLTNVQLNQAGNYAALVANAFGSILSSNAMLWVQIKYDFTYTTNNGTITISGYTGSGGSVAIPAIINGLPVTSIGDYAFNACASLTSVMIGTNVTIIGDWAFYECTNLTGVTIGNSVTSIGKDVFANCASLTAITVDPNNPVYSSVNGVLFDKGQTTLIACPNGLTGNYTIPNSVISIGAYAFATCRLTSVTIDNSVTNIGDYAFIFCTNLTSVTIGNNVTSIGYAAFVNCIRLTSVTIPDSVTSLGGLAFGACTSLTNVMIPNSVTSLGGLAFEACTSLTSVTIPDSVSSIGLQAFFKCASLTNATIGDGVTNVGNNVFLFSGLTSVTIGSNIGDQMFYNCTKLTSVTIGNSVTSIGNSAFEFCSLTSVTIGNSVTSIGNSAFQYCLSLTNVTIPNSVTNIGDFAFFYCTSLASIYFQGNAPSADSTVFYGNNNATVYYLPGTTGWENFFQLTGLTPVLWNPQAQSDASFGVRTNRFGFNITGSSNLVIVVEACTDLANPVWTPIGTNTLNISSVPMARPISAIRTGRIIPSVSTASARRNEWSGT